MKDLNSEETYVVVAGGKADVVIDGAEVKEQRIKDTELWKASQNAWTIGPGKQKLYSAESAASGKSRVIFYFIYILYNI